MRKVGLGYHYPPLPRWLKTYMIVVPIIFLAMDGRWPDSVAWGWVAMVFGLFAMGWLLETAKLVLRWFQRMGYEAALDDLKAIRAKLIFAQAGPDDRPGDEINAVIHQLESKTPS